MNARFSMWRAPGSFQRPGIRNCQPGIGVAFETKVPVEVSKGPVSHGKPEGGGKFWHHGPIKV